MLRKFACKLRLLIREMTIPHRKTLVEVAAHTIDAALAAEAGGADRVELFSNHMEGGVTPSEGAIAVVRDHMRIDLHVMIRPRGGDFCYSEHELDAMHRDISGAKRLGANGVVFGILNPDGTVAEQQIRELAASAQPLSITFHRAFDRCRDLPEALSTLISCGVDRVLTSGGMPNAAHGIENIANLVSIAGGRIRIMAGGGVTPQNVRKIVLQSGVTDVHAGVRSIVPGKMLFRNQAISSQSEPHSYETVVIQEADVRRLVDEARVL
jgi:copper homeostasis protein